MDGDLTFAEWFYELNTRHMDKKSDNTDIQYKLNTTSNQFRL